MSQREASLNRNYQCTSFQTAVLLVLLIGGLGGCIGGIPPMRSAAPEPPPCASRIPTTRKLWSIVGGAMENQVSTCCRSDSGMPGMAGQAFRAAFICSMIPVTPVVVGGLALGFTPLFVPLDLLETSGCAEIGAPEPVPTGQEAVTPDRHSPAGDQRSSPSSSTP
jgi:hypothetical protein